MNNEPHFFQQNVSEADIDWILCIELNSSDSFRDWFASRIFDSARHGAHLGSWRSISNNLGESDLLWLVRVNNGQQRLALIENKINAAAQPLQYERYHQRGLRYVSDGLSDDFVTVLIAPEAYRSSDSKSYEIRISYESIADWFLNDSSEHAKFFARIFTLAAGKLVRLAPSDQEMTAFRRSIWQLALRDFPLLELNDIGEISASVDWVEKSYGSFWIKYKMFKKSRVYGDCVVDLELPGRANDTENLRQQYAEELKCLGAAVVKTRESAAFRIEVPKIVPPNFNESAVRSALTAANNLLSWWRGNEVPR